MAWKLGPLRIEGRFLKSHVARRIFVSVVLCALLPLTSFVILAFFQVTDQLEHDARERLEQDAKQAGMTVLEKLLVLDATLRVLDGAVLAGGKTPTVEDLPAPLAELARGRFRALGVTRAETASPGDAALLAPFHTDAPEDLHHLEHGGALLRVTQIGDATRIAIAHRVETASGPRLVAAEIDPQFLFAAEGLRPSSSLDVVTEGGLSVFHTDTAADEETRSRTTIERFGGWPTASVGSDSLAGSWGLFLRPVFRAPAWSFILSVPDSVVLAPVQQFRAVFPLVALLSLFGVGLASLVLIRRQLVPIEILHAATRRMAARDFGARVEIASDDEFQDLGCSFNEMAESIEKHVTVMETVNAVGSALSVERDREHLLEIILQGAVAVTGARAGALHLAGRDDRIERLLLHGSTGDEVGAEAGRLDELAVRVAAAGEAIDDERSGTLSIPMCNHEAEVIGVLQLIAGSGSGGFTRESRDLAESLASQTAVTLTRDRLAGEFRGLFEGLIQLLVRAIDEKSPYTGAHCRRVPILTEMIADAACATTEGPLKEFVLSDAERYELRIAALLHDCGKVTTPVHVQDKATKLETLMDAIQLVELRFEIVRRDLALEHLRVEDDGALADSLRQLDEDRAFLRTCNTGGEFMDRRLQDRVREIAARWRWRGPDGHEQPILDAQEVENLTIERGTLNPHEREVINQHVVATIQMLEQLPYPRSLRNVPFIAGCHHERMDGCGYPNHLTREQMSLQARILGLADVFEALTAKDRPYKRAMKVRTALDVLGRMKDEGHIDPDLFDVFLREKVFLRYAARWLDPEQIDEDLLDEAALAMIEDTRALGRQ